MREKSEERGYVCDACGKEIFDYPNRRLCAACEGSLECNEQKTCPKCGRKTLADGVCLSCKSRMPKFTQGFSPFSYEGVAAGLVNKLKNGNRRLAFYLGEQTCAYFLARARDKIVGQELLIVPVPLSLSRLQERGYNQAEELAKAIEKTLFKSGIQAKTDADVLQKRRDAPPQKHLSGKERAENAIGAYHVHKRKLCDGKTVLLVDDILTTGATGGECAKLLLSSGASAVYFLTAASMPEKK